LPLLWFWSNDPGDGGALFRLRLRPNDREALLLLWFWSNDPGGGGALFRLRLRPNNPGGETNTHDVTFRRHCGSS
jgi:hypothetical protein